MKLKKRQFYYYCVECKDNSNKSIEFENIIKEVMNKKFKEISPELYKKWYPDSNVEYYYTIEFEKKDNQTYSGRIIKSKNSLLFKQKRNDKNEWTSLNIDKNTNISDWSKDVANFVAITKGNKLYILLEIAFQTGGIGKITELFKFSQKEKLIDNNLEFKSSYLPTPNNKLAIKNLLSKNVDEIFIKLKNNNFISNNNLNSSEKLKAMNIEGFVLTLRYSLTKYRKDGKTERITANKIFDHIIKDIFGISENKVIEELLLDPDILSQFNFLTFRTIDGKRTNLKNMFDLEIIEYDVINETPDYNILIKKLSDKIK